MNTPAVHLRTGSARPPGALPSRDHRATRRIDVGDGSRVEVAGAAIGILIEHRDGRGELASLVLPWSAALGVRRALGAVLSEEAGR